MRNTLNTIVKKLSYSDAFILIIPMIGILGFVFQYEIEAILILCTLLIILLLSQHDVLPTFLLVVIIGMVPLARHADVEYFVPFFRMFEPFVSEEVQGMIQNYEGNRFVYLVAPYVVYGVIVSFFLHFILYPEKFQIGRFFYPTIAVAVAVSIGGLGYTSFGEYFSFPAIFYVFFLGIGTVLAYIFLEMYLPRDNPYMGEYFAKMMLGVGIMGIGMLASGYYQNIDQIIENGPSNMFQWRNNLSNNLLLSMPFAFYLALKKKHFALYFAIGVLQFFTLVLSYSRGGILFSTLVFPFVLVSTLALAKGERLKTIFTLTVVVAGLYLIFDTYIQPPIEIIEDLIARVTFSREESRYRMFLQALERFREYPIFGTGFAKEVHYTPQPMALSWYHSTISQVIGSMGLVGIVAYVYQELVRLFTIVEVRSKFNLAVLFSIIGFGGYSLVNVGYFVPLPFVVMVLTMFMVAERYNKILKDNPELAKEEALSLK